MLPVKSVRLMRVVCAAFVFLGWGFARMPSAHAVTSVHVIPARPTTQDSITVSVWLGYPDACWNFVGKECHPVNGNQIMIDAYMLDDYAPGMVCGAYPPTFSFACEYGMLSDGHYVVTVTTHHQSLRYPNPIVSTVAFDVFGVISVEGTTWGAIKALFVGSD